MSGTVTGTSDKPRKWSAEKKAENAAGTLAVLHAAVMR